MWTLTRSATLRAGAEPPRGTRRELPWGGGAPWPGPHGHREAVSSSPWPALSPLPLASQNKCLRDRLSRSPCTALPMQSEVTCEKKKGEMKRGREERTDLLMPILCCSIIINAKGTTLERCHAHLPRSHPCSALTGFTASIFSRGLPLPWAARPPVHLPSPGGCSLLLTASPGFPLPLLFAQVLFKHPNQVLHLPKQNVILESKLA